MESRELLEGSFNSSKKYFRKKQSQLGYLPARSVPIEGDDFKTPAPSLSPNLSMESRELLEGSFNSSLQPRIIHPAPSSNLSNSNNLAVSAVAREDEHEVIARLCREVARAEGKCTSDDDDEDVCEEEEEEE